MPGADLETGIDAARQAGFSFYEPRIPLLENATVETLKRSTTDLLRGLSWLPLNALEGFLELETSVLQTEADSVFSLAKQFAISQLIVVPGKAGKRKASLTKAGEELRSLADSARSHGVSLLYELIGFPTHVFPALGEALVVSREAGVPLVLDTFHLAVSQTSPADIRGLSAEAIGLVHLSDAITEGKAGTELLDEDRVLPGEGGLPLAVLLGAIGQTGYRGAVSVEVFHPKYGASNPHDVACEAYRRAVRVLSEAGWPV
jgi:4-hydroxyphenylpyruvate dioxygenase